MSDKPEILPPSSAEVGMPQHRWFPSEKTFWRRPGVRLIFSACGALTAASVLLGYFLQLRGVVNLIASRLCLVGIVIALAIPIWIWACNLNFGKWRFAVGAIMTIIVVGAVLWIDRVTLPKATLSKGNSGENRKQNEAESSDHPSDQSEQNTQPLGQKSVLPTVPPQTLTPRKEIQRRTGANAPSTVIETAPAFGNLSERADALSDDIMQELCMHGWRVREGCPARLPVMQLPAQSRDTELTNYFKYHFLPKVVDMRSEFAQLHIRDEQLDDLLASKNPSQELDKQGSEYGEIPVSFLPQEIERVSERLKVLATQARIQEKPKALNFSTSRVAPKPPKFLFDTVITITSETLLSRGYIVVEFDGDVMSASTDFKDSHLITQFDVQENRELIDYFSAYKAIRMYALKIGDTPLKPNQPIHVFAQSVPAHLVAGSKVTWFDE